MQWAAELLPASVHFVGGHPIILSESIEPEGARADLFDGKLFCLTPGPSTEGTAVQLASDVAEALGAKPFFMNAEEHDGLAAGVEQLPSLLAAALLSVTSSSPGWRDMRRLAANQFFASTLMISQSGKEAVAGPLANRENTIHWLDAMAAELTTYRDQLARGDADDLAARIDEGIAAGRGWLNATYTGNWDVDDAAGAEMPTAGSTMRDMFFGRRNFQGRGKQGEQGKRK
jgi:prephenate dehydrogenase